MAIIDSMRDSWDRLNDRERRLISAMAAIAAVVIIFVATWVTSSALAEVEEERDALRKVLQQIDRSGAELAERDAQRQATRALYDKRMPSLAAFLESKAKEESLEVRQVVEQPDKEIDGYRRQQVRVNFSGISLRALLHFLTSIEAEELPLAIERLHIEHYQSGDSFNSQVGVVAFTPYKAPKKDKSGGKKK